MQLTDESILEEYNQQKKYFTELNDIVYELIYSTFKAQKLRLLSIANRVKTYESLKGKLIKHEGKYKQLSDLTDIMGVRIITFFTDEVDIVGNTIQKIFKIDWDNSIDKRKTISSREFGYLSLHYICSLPENFNCPEELKNLKFEIQIRTGLQHMWAEIEHDIGYKGQSTGDMTLTRRFAQLAGLLEIADKEFMELRDNIKNYKEEIRKKILLEELSDISLNSISLEEFMEYDKVINNLFRKILEINNSESIITKYDSYLEKLNFLGITNLTMLDNFVKENSELAWNIALKTLTGTDLDILSSTTTLYYLCTACLVRSKFSDERIEEFFMLDKNITKEKAKLHLKKILNYRNEYCIDSAD